MNAPSQSRLNSDELQRLVDRHRRELSLRDGTRLCIRPILPADKSEIAAGMSRLSPESRYRRFMTALDNIPEDRLKYLTEIDYDNHFAWAAFALDEPGTPGIAVARYVRDPAQRHIAEPAVAVIDEYHGRGLGTLLLSLLTTTAVEHGIRTFRASLLDSNTPMREILHHAGATFHAEGYGVLSAEVELPARDRARHALLSGMVRNACEAAISRAQTVFTNSLVLKGRL